MLPPALLPATFFTFAILDTVMHLSSPFPELFDFNPNCPANECTNLRSVLVNSDDMVRLDREWSSRKSIKSWVKAMRSDSDTVWTSAPFWPLRSRGLEGPPLPPPLEDAEEFCRLGGGRPAWRWPWPWREDELEPLLEPPRPALAPLPPPPPRPPPRPWPLPRPRPLISSIYYVLVSTIIRQIQRLYEVPTSQPAPVD